MSSRSPVKMAGSKSPVKSSKSPIQKPDPRPSQHPDKSTRIPRKTEVKPPAYQQRKETQHSQTLAKSHHSPVRTDRLPSPKPGKPSRSPQRNEPTPIQPIGRHASKSPTKQPTGGHASTSPHKLQREKTFVSQRSGESQVTTPEDFMTCELCRQMLDDPKTLSCLHSYCRGCLMTYIPETSGTATDSSVIICPLCLQTTDAPREAKSIEEWANYLPTNEFLSGYLEAVGLKDSHRKCDSCKRQGRREYAVHWCPACHNALCEDCVGVHGALKTTKQHKVVALSQVRKQTVESIITSPHCQTHTGETVTKYCEIHREVICEKCAANIHKTCKRVKPLKEAALHHADDVKKTNDLLVDEAALAKSIFDDRVQADKTIDVDQSELLQSVRAVRQRINEHLARCESQIIAEMTGIHSKEKTEIQTDVKEAQRIRKSASKLLGLSSKALKYGSDSHALQILPEAEVQGEHYRSKLSSLNGKIKNLNVEFLVEDVLGRLMTNVNRLGELQVRSSNAEVPSSQLLKPQRFADSDPEDEYDIKASRRSLKSGTKSVKSVRITEPPAKKVSASFLSKFSGRTVSDIETCWFTGVALMPNGLLFLVDRNNSKIKIFNKDHALISDYKLSHQPFGIAVVAANEIAVTLPRENKIELFNFRTKLTHKQTIVTSDRCYGISYAAERFAVTCACASPPSLKIISNDGEEKHDICPEEDFYPMFFRPWYVKMDAGGSYSYVSDCHRCHVTCISGSVLRRYVYKDASMNSPRGLFVLPDGRCIVCGFGSDNVQLISENGQHAGDILSRSDGIIGPQEVTYDTSTNTMYLTFDPSSGQSDDVSVYKITI